MIEEGDSNMQRIIGDVMAHRSGALTYDQLAATLEDIGTPYQYGTFYMNTSTYKSLVATGRLQLFPEDINRKLRDYYEYVSKRVDDNNAIVDRITLAYYNEHHPLGKCQHFSRHRPREQYKSNRESIFCRPRRAQKIL